MADETPEAHASKPAQDVALAFIGHVTILKGAGAFAEYRDVLASARTLDSTIIAAAPFTYAEMQTTPTAGQWPVLVKGVDPEQFAPILDLARYMTGGSFQALAEPDDVPTIVIGKQLMTALHAYVGATITLTLISDSASPPPEFAFRIGGVFDTRNADYDSSLAFASLATLQDVVGLGDVVYGVDLRLADATRAPEIARRMETILGGPPYLLMDWYQQLPDPPHKSSP